ncbi:MAG: hypothetical protein SNJ71_06740 [Bacteroidales bacterium]
MNQLKRYIVNSNQQVGYKNYLLKFDRDFDFVPGQVLGITTSLAIPCRYYSICSANQNPDIHILYTVSTEGLLSPLLSKLKKGDALYVSSPRGNFTHIEPHSVCIAAGTGIAPFYSILTSNSIAVQLIHGSGFYADLYGYNFFKTLLQETYIPCLSKETNDKCNKGRVTDYLKNTATFDTDKKYYLCGSAEMVVECRDILVECNIPFTNISAEIYF